MESSTPTQSLSLFPLAHIITCCRISILCRISRQRRVCIILSTYQPTNPRTLYSILQMLISMLEALQTHSPFCHSDLENSRTSLYQIRVCLLNLPQEGIRAVPSGREGRLRLPPRFPLQCLIRR